jgi:hypothetical protein
MLFMVFFFFLGLGAAAGGANTAAEVILLLWLLSEGVLSCWCWGLTARPGPVAPVIRKPSPNPSFHGNPMGGAQLGGPARPVSPSPVSSPEDQMKDVRANMAQRAAGVAVPASPSRPVAPRPVSPSPVTAGLPSQQVEAARIAAVKSARDAAEKKAAVEVHLTRRVF